MGAPIVPTASYDEIADWYEEKFLGRQRAGVRAQRDDPLGINPPLRDLLGEGPRYMP